VIILFYQRSNLFYECCYVLGPDGFNPGFYQNFWNNFGLELFDASYSWFEAEFFFKAWIQ